MNRALFYLWFALTKRRVLRFSAGLRRPTTLIGFGALLSFIGFLFYHREHEVLDQLIRRETLIGCGMVMLGGVRDNEFGRHIAQPDEIGGRETQCACVTVTDCKAHYERAKAAGAVIVDDYAEKDYGGAGYSCHDPEGHLWYIGSYDPWQPE